MTANLPKTVFRLGENDVLYGAEGASRVPDLDRPQFAAPVVLSPAVIDREGYRDDGRMLGVSTR